MSALTFVLIFVVAVVSMALGLYCGRLLFSPDKNYDGFIDVSEKEAGLIYQIELTTNPEQLKEQNTVTMKVRKFVEEK